MRKVQYTVTRDGRPVAGPFQTFDDAYSKILKMQPQSVHHAMAYEGYGVRTEDVK